MIRILNKYKCTQEEQGNAINIMRGHPLGNPYVIGKHGTREEVIRDYKPYLIESIKLRYPEIINELRRIHADSSLMCCCVPYNDCHGYVIKSIMEEILSHGDFDKGLEAFIAARSTPEEQLIQIPTDGNIVQIVGSVLDQTDVHAIVNTVNCVGVMGKGIALEFKKEYPENFRIYQRLCLNKQVHVGKMLPYHIQRPYGPKYVINFPTKLHWRNDSKIEYIAEGLEDLKRLCQELFITKIAMPRLGCGNGGLDWLDVLPLIKQVFSDPNIEVRICYQFRLIIAGSRDIDDYELVKQAYRQSGFEATEIVSGHARGIDKCGERFSEELLGHKAKLFPADWDHLGRSAGYVRNEQMASYADGLLAIWDGRSPGTKSMIDIAYKRKLKVYVVSVLQEGNYVNH